MQVVVVGAGLAGLACARELVRAQVSVVLVEASDGVGGRVRTDVVDGFRIDRGFQVLFTEYPAVRRLLDVERLALRTFDPGALIARGDRRHVFADPARDPDTLLPSLASGIVPVADKLRAWRLSAELSAKPVGALLDGPDQSIERYLRRRGFSDAFLDAFARPFFGGVFLDRSLSGSARLFRYYWKMLVDGDTAVPAAGMGALAEQLAAEIEPHAPIRLNSPVAALVRRGGAVAGVALESGEVLNADAVVVAATPPETARLTGLDVPTGSRGVTTVYLATRQPIVRGKKIVLHANARPVVHHLAPMSNVAPELAPDGWHLSAACLLDPCSPDDATVGEAALADLRRAFAGDRRAEAVLTDVRRIAVVRTPHAQMAQPPGFDARLVPTVPGEPGLRIAGEICAGSSIDGALRSGEAAAASLRTA